MNRLLLSFLSASGLFVAPAFDSCEKSLDVLKKARLDAARNCQQAWAGEFEAGRESAYGVYVWSQRWMWAQQHVALKGDTTSPEQDHIKRCQTIDRVIKQRVVDGRAGASSYLAADYYLSDARSEAGKGSETFPRPPDCATYAQVRVASANLVYDELFNGSPPRKPSYLDAARWSRRLYDAQLKASTDKSGKIAAAKAYLERAKAVQEAGDKLFTGPGIAGQRDMLAYYVADAELLVSQMTTEKPTSDDLLKRAEWKRSRESAAKRAYEKSWDVFRIGGHISVEEMFEWSSYWRASLETPAAESHLSRMRDVREPVEKWYAAGRIGIRDLLAARYFVADAAIAVENERSRR